VTMVGGGMPRWMHTSCTALTTAGRGQRQGWGQAQRGVGGSEIASRLPAFPAAGQPTLPASLPQNHHHPASKRHNAEQQPHQMHPPTHCRWRSAAGQQPTPPHVYPSTPSLTPAPHPTHRRWHSAAGCSSWRSVSL
jgi:hypothetical protein